ncbi:ribosomal RNA-processing protein 8 [Bombina bombina]|uniref:ribosomal RNA-processing protein 8 n=1 Tax=Bombina bombina TaxID=8345 RepID=UPI00235AA241|nr:ribosomal RNA-processing protein 8 [Bombina bombina]
MSFMEETHELLYLLLQDLGRHMDKCFSDLAATMQAAMRGTVSDTNDNTVLRVNPEDQATESLRVLSHQLPLNSCGIDAEVAYHTLLKPPITARMTRGGPDTEPAESGIAVPGKTPLNMNTLQLLGTNIHLPASEAHLICLAQELGEGTDCCSETHVNSQWGWRSEKSSLVLQLIEKRPDTVGDPTRPAISPPITSDPSRSCFSTMDSSPTRSASTSTVNPLIGHVGYETIVVCSRRGIGPETSVCNTTTMFDLCDWNDSVDAPSLPESLVSAQGEGAQKEKVASSRKKRLKRTRQLIEILRSLETPRLQESKDNESPPDVLLKKKPKRAEAQEPRLNNNVQPTNNEVQTTAVGCHSAPADPGPRLSRQQWRNKQKNKKRNKNKFKQLMDPVVQKEGTVKGKVVGEGTKEEVAGLEKGESKHLDGATTSAIHTEGKSTAKEAAVWSKRSKNNGLSDKVTTQEKQRLQKIKKILERGKADKSHIDQKKETELPTDCVEEEAMDDKSSLLRSRMEERLSSGRFRFLNQQLYTSHSHEALRLFQDDPEAFTVYHNGFSRQVQHWPVNPVTEILKYIKNR